MMPLYEMLLNFPTAVRLHTPGHKGRLGGIFEIISKYDITELNVTDDLYNPTGPILKSEYLAKEYFGTTCTFFSAGGATLCIQTALSSFYGKKILVEKNSHISVFNAISLLCIEPVYLHNNISDVPLPISVDQIAVAFKKNPDVAAVFLTSPNYFGLTANLKSIRQLCDESGIKLVVDNSHGTHLFVLDHDSSAEKTAHICIDSAHKTLPVLTGGAFLHYNIPVDYYKIKENMRLFGSTSPNFLILASLDYARDWLENNGNEQILKTASRLQKLKEYLKEKGFNVLDTEPLRLTIISSDAKNILRRLEEKNIYFEMSTSNALVALFSPFNTEADFTKTEDFFQVEKATPTIKTKNIKQLKTTVAMEYKKALLSASEKLSPQKAVGRICAKNIIPYPPGIPIVLAGEIVTAEISELVGCDIDVVKESL